MLIALIIASALVGLTLCIVGRRGIRLNDHPICRACRYDLVERDPLPDACPECGRNLLRRNALVHGRRQRRSLPIVFGVLLMVGAGGLGLRQAWGPLTAFDWYTVRPNWMLVTDANGVDAEQRRRAVAEVFRRIDTGRMDRPAATAWVDRALDAQGDLTQSWITDWAKIIECAEFQGWLDTPRRDRYLAQAVAEQTLLLPTRPLPQGGTLRTSIKIGPLRAPASGGLFSFDFNWSGAEIDGQPLGIESASRTRSALTVQRNPSELPLFVKLGTAAGDVVIKPTGVFHFVRGGEAVGATYGSGIRSWVRGSSHTGGTVWKGPPPAGTVFAHPLSAAVPATVVPPESIVLPPITDPAYAADIRNGIGAPTVTCQTTEEELASGPTTFSYVHVVFELGSVERVGAFDVIVRFEGSTESTWLLLTGDRARGSSGFGSSYYGITPPQTIDLELRPNAEAWRTLSGAEGILTESIVFEDLPVTHRSPG